MADADLLQMQQDAIRRVRMMQQKAQRTMEDSTPKSTGKKADAVRTHAHLKPRKAVPPAPERATLEKLLNSDSERTLLLVLLLVLLDENSDLSLIMALLYLIL